MGTTHPITMAEATDPEREWCAELTKGSEPWITLGRGVEQCRAVRRRPGRRGGAPGWRRGMGAGPGSGQPGPWGALVVPQTLGLPDEPGHRFGHVVQNRGPLYEVLLTFGRQFVYAPGRTALVNVPL